MVRPLNPLVLCIPNTPPDMPASLHWRMRAQTRVHVRSRDVSAYTPAHVHECSPACSDQQTYNVRRLATDAATGLAATNNAATEGVRPQM